MLAGGIVSAAFVGEKALLAFRLPLVLDPGLYIGYYFSVKPGAWRYTYRDRFNIRNTDPDHQITILSVDYYASDGKLLKYYLKQPRRLDPMASARYFVKESDKSGSSGANFLVKWKSEQEVNEPIIEGVMIGAESEQGISLLP